MCAIWFCLVKVHNLNNQFGETYLVWQDLFSASTLHTGLLGRRKILVLSLALVLTTQLLVSSELNSADALTGTPPSIRVDLKMDSDNAKGFESVGGTIGTPLFVLKRGNTGSINITLSSSENETVHGALRYGGDASTNYRYWSSPTPQNIPDGITYSFEPSVNFTLAPYSSVTKTLRISASKDTAIRNYNLTLDLILEKVNPLLESGVQEEGSGHSTSLTIIDSTSSIPSTTNSTSIAKITAPYITQTTTLTSTTTTTIATRLTEGATASLVYAWAIGATIVAAALAAVLLRSKRRG